MPVSHAIRYEPTVKGWSRRGVTVAVPRMKPSGSGAYVAVADYRRLQVALAKADALIVALRETP